MKFKRKWIALLFTTAILASATLCSCGGQTNGKGILSIEKSGQEGLTDYYTISYTDGTTDVFTVTNGKDGENIDANALYEAYLEEYPTATYEDFLNAILSVSVESESSVNQALRSSLKVYTEFTESYRSFQGIITDTALYMGAAVVYSIESDYTYLITNYHVIYDTSASTESKIAKKITCYLYGSEAEPISSGQKDEDGCTVYDYGEYAIECSYVGGCAAADIAVLKTETATIQAVNEDVQAVEFAQSYQVGQTAIAVGNPNGEGISVTEGIVSVDNEFIQLSVDGTTRDYRSIRIDTALYGGNSGGGLFDKDGKLIGIANAGNGDDQNINYAVPLSIVKNVAESILYYGERGETQIKKLTFGVTVSSENVKYVYDAEKNYGTIVEDVIVQSTTDGSIARSWGLVAGDILRAITINGVSYEINRYFDVSDIAYLIREGDVISLSYERNQQTQSTQNYTVLSSDLTAIK